MLSEKTQDLKNPFSSEYLINGKILDFPKLIKNCPDKFNNMANPFRSFMNHSVKLKGKISGFEFKTKDEAKKEKQFSIFNQVLLAIKNFPTTKDNTRNPDIVSVASWLMSVMLVHAPSFEVEEVCEV